ncbi:hypothetical protein ABT369_48915 [Dactylosporangium sp. NPDC000244]|uniref:hypothetical protein n=1 Tax=Dactylosporangium sp. NPDC000244 TaxID=3154365 RepID=UPI0033237659
MTVHDDSANDADPRQDPAGVCDRVAALGGTLSLTGPAGRGTSLTVMLPVGEQDWPGAEAEAADSPSNPPAPTGTRLPTASRPPWPQLDDLLNSARWCATATPAVEGEDLG